MKTKILILILCVLCAGAYGQTRKKRRRTKPAATRPVVDTTRASAASSARPDTGRKLAAKPLKPFDRPLDGYFKKTNILSAKVTPYPNIRESDASYVKRVWREIDVREKMNTYLASPKQNLISVLLDAIKAGELTAYDPQASVADDPNGDSFSVPLNPDEVQGKLVDSSSTPTQDNQGNITGSKMVAGVFTADSVIKFRLKEDWIFDKQRSVFEPRIIGIAPMRKKNIAGQDLYFPAFWIYFPDARKVLAVKEVVSRDNDNTGLSFDDIFMKRIFTSYIVKVSNEKNEDIRQENFLGIDKLYESERIKKNLMDWELSLWQY
jgi:gliding motility associated protien GldN